jgi:malonyl-CoA decarboxylase
MESPRAIALQSHRFMKSIAAKYRDVLTLIQWGSEKPPSLKTIIALVEDLLSVRGESAGNRIANDLFTHYNQLSQPDKVAFLNLVADGYGPDPDVLDAAIQAYRNRPGGPSIAALRSATDSPRQIFFRRLNLADNGTLKIVKLREDVLKARAEIANFATLDADLSHVITPWFNIGFLTLQQMDWSSPANVLHKIISYEAVHEVKGWDDLRRRVEPADRRCFAFFHPRMPDEPLIFVEVALMPEIPADIGTVLDESRTPIAAEEASVAVFYSISNCQEGLRGIPFGNTLIKQVVELLSRKLANIKTFVTLSPVPGLATWLAKQRDMPDSVIPADQRRYLAQIGTDWTPDDVAPDMRQALLAMTARYFLEARTLDGKVIDPVARFHLGNGAQLERINFAGDGSRNGLKQAHGVMVNYLYRSSKIEKNAQRFAEANEVVSSLDVKRLLEA